MAAFCQGIEHVRLNSRLDVDLIGLPLIVDAGRADRLAERHMKVEHVHDHLQHGTDDPAAARRTGDQQRLAVFQDDGRRHRRQRPLARTGQIGVVANQAIGIGRSRLGGEIVKLIVEQHARALGDKAKAIGKIQRVGVRYGIAVAIDHREMRRVAAFEIGRLARADLGRGRRALVDLVPQGFRISFEISPSIGIFTASGSPMKTARSA